LLPKKNRLPAFKIPAVIKNGKHFVSTSLTLIIQSKKTDKIYGPRIAIIVPKKISKQAVMRNKIKKKLREITRELLLKITWDGFVIIMARKPIIAQDYKTTKNELVKLFNRSSLIN
jgi:ribonuclease P protein component